MWTNYPVKFSFPSRTRSVKIKSSYRNGYHIKFCKEFQEFKSNVSILSVKYELLPSIDIEVSTKMVISKVLELFVKSRNNCANDEAKSVVRVIPN